MNIIISELVDIILSYDIYQYTSKLKYIIRDDRVKLASLMVFYSNNEKLFSLNSFLNEILFEDTKCFTCFNVDLQCTVNDLAEYRQFRKKLEENYIYNDLQRDKIANYLYCINKVASISLDFLDEFSKKTQLKVLSDFVKKVFQKKLLLVVDSLDESSYLFVNSINPNLVSLQAVVDAFLDDSLLTLALGNDNDVLFDILVFLPHIKNLEIKWKRVDKIPVISLNWNSKHLHNYADFVLFNLKQQQYGYHCKSLPNFSGLLDDENDVVKHVLDSLRQPRDLHMFMNSLLSILNENANINNEKPFIASKEMALEALEQAKETMYKRR